MKVTFDREKIDRLLFDFYNCTKVPISLFDLERQCLSAYATGVPPYCKNIRARFPQSCAKCDQEHLGRLETTKQVNIYTCHAGICEVMAPVLYGENVIAYLMLGRFRDAEQKFSSVSKAIEAAKRYKLDEEEQLNAYRDLPVFTRSTLDSAIRIAQTCIQYMWTESMISLKTDSLSTKIENYINEHIAESLSIDELCKQFFVSKTTLQAVFRNEFNASVKNYILSKRIALAKQLLKDTPPLPVGEIAKHCGFPDYNYFSRIFRQKTSLSPSAYRKS